MQTTDPQDELFDIVDTNDRIIGAATRQAVHHDKKLTHRAVDVLVFKDNRLLLQKRSKTKDMYPDCWTVSCSGHVLSGDGYEETARRELVEELGIIAKKLEFLTKTIIYYPHETEYVTYYKIEIQDDQKITINTEEIADYTFSTLKKLDTIKVQEMTTPDFLYILPYCVEKKNKR